MRFWVHKVMQTLTNLCSPLTFQSLSWCLVACQGCFRASAALVSQNYFKQDPPLPTFSPIYFTIFLLCNSTAFNSYSHINLTLGHLPPHPRTRSFPHNLFIYFPSPTPSLVSNLSAGARGWVVKFDLWPLPLPPAALR